MFFRIHRDCQLITVKDPTQKVEGPIIMLKEDDK